MVVTASRSTLNYVKHCGSRPRCAGTLCPLKSGQRLNGAVREAGEAVVLEASTYLLIRGNDHHIYCPPAFPPTLSILYALLHIPRKSSILVHDFFPVVLLFGLRASDRRPLPRSGVRLFLVHLRRQEDINLVLQPRDRRAESSEMGRLCRCCRSNIRLCRRGGVGSCVER